MKNEIRMEKRSTIVKRCGLQKIWYDFSYCDVEKICFVDEFSVFRDFDVMLCKKICCRKVGTQ